MHCIVMTWHWTNCRSYYHHFMTRWMCITWKHNCIACAWWTHDLYQQQSTWWAMKQELSEKFAFVIKEKKHFTVMESTVMESTVFLDESQMAKLFNTVCARRFLKTMFFLQSWNTSKKQTSPLHAVFIPLWFFRLISYSVHNSTKLTKSWFVCNWCFYDGRSSFYDWEIFYEGPTVCCYIYNLKQ